MVYIHMRKIPRVQIKKIEKSTNSDEEKKELLKQVKVLKENFDKRNGVSDIFRKYIVTRNEKFVDMAIQKICAQSFKDNT